MSKQATLLSFFGRAAAPKPKAEAAPVKGNKDESDPISNTDSPKEPDVEVEVVAASAATPTQERQRLRTGGLTMKRKAEAVPILWGEKYRVVECKGSALVGQCSQAPTKHRDLRPIMDFCPSAEVGGSRDPRKHAKFLAAVKAYEDAFAARDKEAALKAVALVGDLRYSLCPICRRAPSQQPGYLNAKAQACKDYWNEMRRAAGGCSKCEVKGLEPDKVWQVLQANHRDPNEKIGNLSAYKDWAKKGLSVDKCLALMKLEATKCDFLCGVCHMLDPNSNSANRVRNPEKLPPGKQRGGTQQQTKEYHAKRKATLTFPKKQFVDAEKFRRGECLHCKLKVTDQNVVAFHFDHKDNRTKMKGKGTPAGVQGGVAGLVHNTRKKASLDNIKDILVDEMDKCNLLCANCHHRKTHYGLKIKKSSS